ncbi:MAG: hypothetical protein LBT29_03665 [Flavobacteriaceae bacterium]|jgi:hypothetical protein|nr:hypothetical protein [Flavobacteriaceae bacterium]
METNHIEYKEKLADSFEKEVVALIPMEEIFLLALRMISVLLLQHSSICTVLLLQEIGFYTVLLRTIEK